jgi:hypothetical protein
VSCYSILSMSCADCARWRLQGCCGTTSAHHVTCRWRPRHRPFAAQHIHNNPIDHAQLSHALPFAIARADQKSTWRLTPDAIPCMSYHLPNYKWPSHTHELSSSSHRRSCTSDPHVIIGGITCECMHLEQCRHDVSLQPVHPCGYTLFRALGSNPSLIATIRGCLLITLLQLLP